MDLKFIDGGVTAALGFQASGVKARIKYDKRDVAVIYSEAPASAAGVFTTNKVKAAPVVLSMEHLADGAAQAVVVNSGYANACTGADGRAIAREMAAVTAKGLNIKSEEVIVASTGVIGQQIPMERLIPGIAKAIVELAAEGGDHAAEAIMTTDTVPKKAAVQFQLAGKTITIGGIAKGSGMINPHMATMLSFLTSDVSISPAMLAKALKYAADRSFNMVTVDGDTSTNDSLVILANGLAGNDLIAAEDANFNIFRNALLDLCVSLAKMIARDGEGATKLVEIKVQRADSYESGKNVAMAVANSNLVKTAIFGEDANWGRIICAIGYAGVDVDPGKIDIFIGDEKMAEAGSGLNFSEERAKEILQAKEVTITIDLHMGDTDVTAWTCDFSYDYVKINADYRS